MSKRQKYFLVLFMTLFVFAKRVNAANVSAYITTSKTSATLVVSSSEHIGQIYGTFSCGGLGSKNLQFVASSNPPKSQSYTISWKSGAKGTYTCSVSGFQVGTLESAHEGVKGYSVSSKTINLGGGSSSNNNGGGTSNNNGGVNNKKEDNKSGNNNLKSLAIENYKISPEFDKNKTDYSLTVPYDVNKVKILAFQESKKAKLAGDDGEVEVKEGENELKITVVAENGSKKTYVIKVTVDSKPINITVDGKEYSVVKKKDELPELNIEHSDMKLTIEEQEVDAYRIDKIGYVLVGLKDSDGKIDFYKFTSYKNDEKPAEYKLLKILSVNGMDLIYLDFPKSKIPSGYKKYEEVINDTKYVVYKLNKDSKFSLIYGVNPNNGKENIYKYESSENTLQLYDKGEVKSINQLIEKYQKFGLILIGVIGLLLIITTISITRKGKKEDSEELTKRDIRNIERKTFKEEKKNKKEVKKKNKLEKRKQKKGEPDM